MVWTAKLINATFTGRVAWHANSFGGCRCSWRRRVLGSGTKFAGLFIAAALVLLVHPVVVAVLRGGTVFVWAQAVRMVKRDTQLLVRTAKPVLATFSGIFARLANCFGGCSCSWRRRVLGSGTKFAGLFIAAALVLLVHPVVVAVLRGGTVFVWAQAVRMVKRDTQLLVRTAKPVLATFRGIFARLANSFGGCSGGGGRQRRDSAFYLASEVFGVRVHAETAKIFPHTELFPEYYYISLLNRPFSEQRIARVIICGRKCSFTKIRSARRKGAVTDRCH